ncbi:MAG: TetR/AcrR family transcriptional regulator [Reyranellales bacterium]
MAAIVEAAAQVLETGGLAGFTTNAVAERAGVSIGTLYQYFADKQALLRALADREIRRTLAAIAVALRGDPLAPGEQRVRAMVRALVNAFSGRQRARRAVIETVLAQGTSSDVMQPIMDFLAQSEGAFIRLNRVQMFVLSRALMGIMRAAVVEEQPFFTSRSFEDEAVRLVLAYNVAVSAT